jgi:DME family drug/metabolite transporter
MTPKQLFRGYAFILTAAVLFGTTGTARMLGTCAVAPWITGAFRLIIGGPILLGICLVFKQTNPKITGKPPGPGRQVFALLGASLGVVAFQFAFFEAVSRTGVAAGTLVAIGSAPVFAGLLGALLHGETLDRNWALSTLLALSGCSLLAITGHTVAIDLPGLGLALVAGSGYALYVAAGRSLVQTMAPAKAVGLVLTVGGLIMLPLVWTSDLSGLTEPRALVTLAYLGIFATAASYYCLTAGLVHIPISRAAILLLAEPLVGSLLGICLLKEPFSLQSALGMALIFAGIAVVAVGQGITA